jgi:hypothetical protein
MSSSNRVGDWFITIDERDCGGVVCQSIRLTHVKNEAAELVAIELPCRTEWRVFQSGKIFKLQAEQIKNLIRNHTRTPFVTIPFELTKG